MAALSHQENFPIRQEQRMRSVVTGPSCSSSRKTVDAILEAPRTGRWRI